MSVTGKPGNRLHSWVRLVWVATLLASALLAVIAAEAVVRLRSSEPLFTFRNYRTKLRYLYQQGMPAEPDALLGWKPRSGASGSENTWKAQVTILENGVRSNGAKGGAFRDPPILAVGDSFTFGDEVNDDETWPAALEQLLGRRVINGGVFGYGADQTFLRLKTLLPTYKPRSVIFGLIPGDLVRSEHATTLGVTKPYFSARSGSLELMNTPITQTAGNPYLRNLFGHSLLAHKIMMRLNPNWWLSSGRHFNENPTGESGRTIACLIFRELNELARTLDGRVYILVQATTRQVRPELDAAVDHALGCVDDNLVTVVDLRRELKQIKDTEPERYASFYRVHMTHQGNRYVAAALAAAIRRTDSE